MRRNYLYSVIKQFILGVICLFITQSVFSQEYGNEWIKYNQQYYRFNIVTTGIQKLTNVQLQAAGIPISNFSPQNIQLFFNGKEIPVYIKGEEQGVIEYLLFYAEKNTGWFDVGMYDSPESQTNTAYSMINDTASVFFTWNTSFSNKRYLLESNTNFTGYTAENYCLGSSYVDYPNTYYTSYENSEYILGEGYFDNQVLDLGGSISKTIATPDFVNAGVASQLDLAYISFSKDATFFNNRHHIKVTGPGFSADTLFSGYNAIQYKTNVSVSSLSTSSVYNFSNIDDQGTYSSKIAVSHIKLKYPRGFNFNSSGSFSFNMPSSVSTYRYLEIKGFSSTTETFLLDITNQKMMNVVNYSGIHKVLIPSSSQEQSLWLFDLGLLNVPVSAGKVNFVNYAAINSKTIIISNSKLWDAAQSYAQYRNAYLVNIDELYNQFAYGIQKHPLAIRNFLRYATATWNVKPEYLFIIGKGLQPTEYRKIPSRYSLNLVPTMGYFGSDVLLSTNINGSSIIPAMHTGRLAAQSSTQVTDYLYKVQEFEQNTADEWMKRAIHFGGGNDVAEQNQFKNYLANYERVFEDSLFGGYVSTFLKASSDPIEISANDSITGLIEGGVSLMTFFGHGSAQGGFDQNIDEPDAFNNQGRYPLMLANSCYSGNIHLTSGDTKSEQWVLIPNKGSIAFLAVVGSGYTDYLNWFSTAFYELLARDSYGKKLGEIIDLARTRMQQNAPDDRYTKATIQEFTLHGDPEIVLNSFDKPDLKINASEIKFVPDVITTQIDSFDLQVVCTNQARTSNQSFTVQVQRTFQNGNIATYFYEVAKLYYKQQIQLRLPVDLVNGLGNNTFKLIIDSNNEIDELNEANNSVTVNKYISSSDIVPVIPYHYGLLPAKNLVLKASTADAFVEIQTSQFELDTTPFFDSPALYSEKITHGGGVITWNPSMGWDINKTYFWRTAIEASVSKWAQSSFTLSSGNIGWAQNHAGQITENTLKFITYNQPINRYQFSEAPQTLVCKTLGSPGSATYSDIGYSLNGVGEVSSCGTPAAMLLVVIDSLTLVAWNSDRFERGTIGHVNDPWCLSNRTKGQPLYIFQTANIDNITKMVDFIDTQVPDGSYLLMYTFGNGNFENYTEYIRSKLQGWGADNIRFLNNNIPYIFVTQKGNNSFAEEVIGATTTSRIELYKELKGNFNYGYITSNRIGPSEAWELLNWQSSSLETNNSAEEAFVNIIGIGNDNRETVIADSITQTSYDLAGINPIEYPYLKLVFYTKDDAFKTPAQLKNWQVIYSPVTDLALNPIKGYEFYNDTLIEGENGRMAVAIENIGLKAVDSITTRYWIQNSKNEIIEVLQHRVKPLKAGEYVVDSVNFNTRYLSSNNTFWVEVNPTSTGSKSGSIREQYYFNNLAQKPFFIKNDGANPMLDVTFDGQHIMDGDLVSAKPEIVIQLQDENPYIAMNDTSMYAIYLKSRNTGVEKLIAVSNNSEVLFVPAQLPKNKSQVIYTPDLPDDGIYELRVQAKDISGNISGALDYTISFQVINESTITNVFNYPNPFSTATRFVFELTGSEVPDEMQIEILTISGRVIKVIYLDELGPITIGKNISSYIWNGTDMYGDPLANGVYFYRVKARLNGQELKIRDTGTNQYFKQGFGKMYIMR